MAELSQESRSSQSQSTKKMHRDREMAKALQEDARRSEGKAKEQKSGANAKKGRERSTARDLHGGEIVMTDEQDTSQPEAAAGVGFPPHKLGSKSKLDRNSTSSPLSTEEHKKKVNSTFQSQGTSPIMQEDYLGTVTTLGKNLRAADSIPRESLNQTMMDYPADVRLAGLHKSDLEREMANTIGTK